MEESKIPEGIGLPRKRQRGGKDEKEEKRENNGGGREARELKTGTGKDASDRESSVGPISNVALSLTMRRSCWSIREHD